MKRSSDAGANGHPHKKIRREHPQTDQHQDALAQLPPPTSKSGLIPAYVHFTVPPGLPSLPPVQKGPLSEAPFRHKSTVNYDRSTSVDDLTYERLEFLGDAYLEIIASRLIFERFKQLTTGQQSQLRELLVKNETLSDYSRAYGFDKRVEADAVAKAVDEGKKKGNKGFNKILGDVFEAYVAAVVLSDAEDGFAVAEKWLTALWAPKLVEAAAARNVNASVIHDVGTDLMAVYDPTAKQQLQTRIFDAPYSKLEYETYQDSIELKGDQLGQNKHFIGLYLTGYGYDRVLIGKGEGKNKAEAGNWAALQALKEKKAIVDDCEAKIKARKLAKRAQKLT